MARPLQLASIACVVITACMGTPGAAPHDMSVAQHEREADAHARSAEAHEDQFDPDAGPRGCFRAAGRRAERRIICWTSVRNPTAVHLAAAEAHRRNAAEHRAASAALRARRGHRERSGAALREADPRTRLPRQPRGGGGRHVPCRRWNDDRIAPASDRLPSARNASLGHVVPELPNCPLVPPGVRARVSSTDDGFAVAIRSRNARVAREILSRARRLVPPAGNDTAPERESSS